MMKKCYFLVVVVLLALVVFLAAVADARTTKTKKKKGLKDVTKLRLGGKATCPVVDSYIDSTDFIFT